MIRIDHTNYEELYLDYLEGNLQETDKRCFELFLINHPELVEEMDIQPILIATDALPTDFKNRLKIFDESEKITAQNAESFIIADLEGDLNSTKQKELSRFLSKSAHWQQVVSHYALTKLTVSQKLVYPNKAALKKKENRVLWPIWSAALAACLAGVFYWLSPNPSYPIQHAAHRGNSTNHRVESSHLAPSTTTFFARLEKPLIPASLAAVKIGESDLTTQADAGSDIGSIPFRKAKIRTPQYLDRVEIEPLANKTEIVSSAPAYDYALAMKDPNPLVTRTINDVIKKEVIYQKGMNVETQRKGFFLKIGKLEISTNRKIKTSKE